MVEKRNLMMAGLVFLSFALSAQCQVMPAANQPASQPVQSSMFPMAGMAQTPEQKELMQISTENQISDQKLKKKLQQVNEEKEELRVKYELMLQKQKSDIASMAAELEKASTQNKLLDETTKTSLAEMAKRVATLKAENDLKAEQQRALSIANALEKANIEIEVARMDLQDRQLKHMREMLDSRMFQLKSDLEFRAKKEEWKKESNSEPVYADMPFINNRKLIISDRRIPLNGPIFRGVATYVNERISYYNNISSAPIFIVIDNCPGGSVQEGYRILKGMEASKAPVYVVVKSFAASMAAIITTLAKDSYVYPNAQILHHQMSTFAWGNMTEIKEQYEMAKQWETRMFTPVAKKAGLSIEEFRKKMYQKNSDGDWVEFGDKAVELKWANHVVEGIDETSYVKNPDAAGPKPVTPIFIPDDQLVEKTDEKGQRYVLLPRLDPCDFYFIYNPDRYYR